MSRYLMKYKGKYRILGELDKRTNDFPRDANGDIDESYNDLYVYCQYGNRITEYGHLPDNKKTVWLTAYIPSLGRGRNIKKALDSKGIQYIKYHETDEEVEFLFKPKDIEVVAELLKARTSGANISPFSQRNLPRSDVEIPTDEIERYKKITSRVQKSDLLLIKNINNDFLQKILQKQYKKMDKSFDYVTDMRKMKMSRQTKEYIWSKGLWEEYLAYLEKEITKFYKNK